MTTATDAIVNEPPVQNPRGGLNPQPPTVQHDSPDAETSRAPLNLQAVMLPAVLLLIVAYFSIASPGYVFLSPRNLSMLAIELSVTAVLALGMLLVILPGHIDLSVGSGVGLLGGVAAVLVFHQNWPAPLALLVGLAGGVALWWLMGWIIVRQRVPAFIITLGGLLVFRGLHWRIIENATVPVSRGGETNLYSALTTFYLAPWASLLLAAVVIGVMAVAALATHKRLKRSGAHHDGEALFLRTFVAGQVVLLFVLVCNAYRGIPLPAVILGGAALVIMVLTRHTPFGRYLYAIGGNEEAAVVSGVPVFKVTIGAFALLGLLTAVTGFLQTAYAGASTTTIGELLELDAIAACVIGGVSLKGGRGTVGGVLLGSLIMAALLNGMTLMAYSPEAKYVIRGSILAAAVWADVRLGKR